MNRVVVTGATGFVGGALTRALLARETAVTALVRPTAHSQPLAALGVELVQGDITQPGSLRGLLDHADGVIHAAGMLGQAGVAEAAYHALHVEGTRHLLDEWAALPNPPRLLYVSSPGVLGPITTLEPADETAPLAPSNPYERSKAAAEQLALGYARRGLPLMIGRPEFIYGPGDQHVLGLFRAVQRGLFFYVGNGRYLCHPTYITDAVDGLLRCLTAGRAGEIYHITGPRPVTFRELGETIAATVGVRPPWLALPRPIAWTAATLLEAMGSLLGRTPPLSRTGVAFFSENRRFSWQKAALELDYAPQFSLQAGVAATVDWYYQQGLLPAPVAL